ncbi:MAG: hypothetical protein M0Z31_05350 [Clostridia bacterium]|nr:hypothetical protein [Clostridia bacterium]
MHQPEQQNLGDNIPMPPMGNSHPYTLPQFYSAGETNPFNTQFSMGNFDGGFSNPQGFNPYQTGFTPYQTGFCNPQGFTPYQPGTFAPQSFTGMTPGGISPFMTYGGVQPFMPFGGGQQFMPNSAMQQFMPFMTGGIPAQPPLFLVQFMQTMLQQMSSLMGQLHQIIHGEQNNHDTLPIPPIDHDHEKYPHLPAAATPQWLNTLISG